MNKTRYITKIELEKYLSGEKLSFKLKALLLHQKEHWPFLREGYESLKEIKVRKIEFEENSIKVQFNPGRIISTSAKVDDVSIRARKCFLCETNLPKEQKALPYNNDYLILSNPFPIFSEHFTIPHADHKPQEILNNFNDMIYLSKEIGDSFTLFYNGPKCGASAPDHLHFQAGEKFFMPLDREYIASVKKFSESLIVKNNIKILAINDGLRKYYSLESKDPEILKGVFRIIYMLLQKYTNNNDEPMMNISSLFENDYWTLKIFPRRAHRPSIYFSSEEERMLISPASVDLGGVIILPREEDFMRINSKIIQTVFDEVMITDKMFDHLKEGIQKEVIL